VWYGQMVLWAHGADATPVGGAVPEPDAAGGKVSEQASGGGCAEEGRR
jgi:hypothetical protein